MNLKIASALCWKRFFGLPFSEWRFTDGAERFSQSSGDTHHQPPRSQVSGIRSHLHAGMGSVCASMLEWSLGEVLVHSGLCTVSFMAVTFISGTSEKGAERRGSSVQRSRRKVLWWWVSAVLHNVSGNWVSTFCFNDCGSEVRTWNWSLELWASTVVYSEAAEVCWMYLDR